MTATRPLASTGIAVTAIGFGAGPLGGFYGAVDAETGAAAARRAYELGVRYFDVAPLYGYGRAELVLGHALRDFPRDDFILSTKIGRYLVPAGVTGAPPRMREEGAPFNPVLDYSRDGTLRALEQSMQRLGMARIDLVYIHDVDAHSQGSESAAEAAFRSAMAGALPALVELKRAGVIRAIGVGLNQPHWALRWVREAELDAVMIAGRLTLLNHVLVRHARDVGARRLLRAPAVADGDPGVEQLESVEEAGDVLPGAELDRSAGAGVDASTSAPARGRSRACSGSAPARSPTGRRPAAAPRCRRGRGRRGRSASAR